MPISLVVLAATALAADVPTKLPEPAVAGRQHYLEHCWACHGKQALGDGPSRTLLNSAAPPLAGLPIPQHAGARSVILHGRGAMPGHSAVLAPDEVDTILIWLSDLDPETGEDPNRNVKKKVAAETIPSNGDSPTAEVEVQVGNPPVLPSDRTVVIPPLPDPPEEEVPSTDGVL